MRTIGLNALMIVASYASVLGLYFTIQPIGVERPTWHWLLLVVASFAFFIALGFEVVAHLRSLPKRLTNSLQVRQYMRDWISSGGRTALFTRDMSWVDEDSRAILFLKAKRNELVVCLESRTELSQQLQKSGAQIYTYEELKIRPSSRFTIVDFERDGARVAVGKKVAGAEQIVQEFRQGEHPFFAVADDLVHFVMALSVVKKS